MARSGIPSSIPDTSLPRAHAFREAFHRRFDTQAADATNDERLVVSRAPGRVNLLGGHTDYNDGFVLPATIDRTAHAVLRARQDESLHLHSAHFGEDATYTLGASSQIDALPGWARYVAGVAEALHQQGRPVGGFEAVVHGDVPLGAGLSSSAALEVAVAVGLDALFSLDLVPDETAKLCQHVEQEYVGVECGIMDQFASRVGRAGHALFLDCRSLEHRHVPLPLVQEDVCLVVADSGVRRELASSKYNERRRECEAAVQALRPFDESVRTLRDVSPTLLQEHGPALPAPLFRRARHVVQENERVEQGAALLAEGRLDAFGPLMNASHASLAEDYEVSCAELDCLTQIARETDGVLGTRMTGAGFGGCIVTLVRTAAVSNLEQTLSTRYRRRFEHDPAFYVIERNLEAGLL